MPLSYAGMHPEDVQQEKNLHYVAATRAKHVLVYLTNNDFLENRVKPTYVQEDFDDHEWTSDGLVLLSDAPDDYEPVTADEAVADEDVADTEPGLLAPLPDYDRQHEFICPQCDTGYERTAAEMLEFACADCDTGLEPIRQAEHDTNEPDKEIPMTDTPNDDIRKTDEIAVAAESADTAVHLVSDDETTSLAADGGADDEPTSPETETDAPVTEATTGKIDTDVQEPDTVASPDGRRYEVVRNDMVIQECRSTESTTDFLRELDFLNDVQVVQWQDDTSQSEDAIAWLIAMAHGDKRQNNSGDVLKPGMRVRTFLDRVATITHFKGFMAYLVDDDGETWGSNLRSLTPLPDADESDDDTADVSPAGESDTEPAEAMTAPMTRQQQLFAPIITADDDTDDTTATDDDDKTVSPTGGSPDSQTRIKLLRPVKVGRSGRKPDSPVTDDDDSGDDVSPVAEADDVSPTGDSTSSSTTQQIQLTPPQSEFLDWALDPMTERIDELAAHGEACEYTADELPRKVPGQQGLYDIPLSQTVLAELKYHAQRYEEIAREQVGNHPNDPSPQEAAGAERSARNAIGKIEALFETTDDAPVSPTGDSTPETPPAKLPAIPRQPTRWAQHMLDHADRVVIVDFETTDKFDRNDPGRRVEPIQMGIIALDGTVLFNERFMPDGDIAPGAAEIHGVTKASLKAAGASHWRDHIDTINAILRGKYIIAYNKKFDMRVYRDTARHYDTPVLDDNWHCAMLAYVAHNPTYDNGKGYGFGSWWKLTTALEKEGLTPDANAHDALADVQMTRQLIEAMAANDPQKWSRITYDGQVVTYKSHTKKAVYARTDTGESVKIPNNDVQWVQPGIDSIPDSNDTPSEAADVPIADSTPEHTDSDPKPQKSPQSATNDTLPTDETAAESDDTPSEAADVPIADSTPEHTDSDPKPQKSPQSATNDALPTDETPFERMERVVGRFASRDEALEWLELVQDVIDNVHPPAQHETETERESEALPV